MSSPAYVAEVKVLTCELDVTSLIAINIRKEINLIRLYVQTVLSFLAKLKVLINVDVINYDNRNCFVNLRALAFH